MDADGVAKVLQAADSFYGVIVLFMLGIFALLWKFGNELLKLARENNERSKQSHRVATDAKNTAVEVRNETRQISRNITTNHGSKHLGDAIDRLTEWMLTHMKEQREADAKLQNLGAEFVLHVADSTVVQGHIQQALVDLDERMHSLEAKGA